MYRAVIFDLDGTLLDSLDDILAVLNSTLERFNLPKITRAQGQTYIGNGARELVRRAIGGDNEYRLDEILASYKADYERSDNSRSRLYEGEEQALLELKANGVKLAVLTNKPHAAALNSEKKFFKRFGFDCVLGQKEGAKLKPEPDAVYAVLAQLGVDAGDCLFVGDGEADVLTARNAHMDCLSVLWGYRTREQLSAVGADRFAENYRQLISCVLQK